MSFYWAFCGLFKAAVLTNRGTYGRDVIGLQVENDFLYCLDALLCTEVHLVVFTANVSCNLTNIKNFISYNTKQ